ncbi:MAG: catalase [Clostridiales bacterium]|nr:catalase [Clostridiales bacterium]
MRHCFKIGLYKQGLLHDLSKYSPSEFILGCRYYQGHRSPNDEERQQLGYSSAWLHHKGKNKHHFEYWIDYPQHRVSDKPFAPVKMPLKYVAEMFCDRMAACKVYMGPAYNDAAPLEYQSKRRGRLFMHPETEEQLTEMLSVLAEKGEEAAFAHVREMLKRGE